MAFTPSEVFEQHVRETSAPSVGQRSLEEQIRTAQRNPTYQGYNRAGSYSNRAWTRPQPYDRPQTSETSFTEAARERNPGLRQRPPTATRPSESEYYEHIRRQLQQQETRINIPETFTESTPLVGGTASAAGIAGTGITGSGLATGLGVVGGALAAGGITTGLVSRYKNKGFVLPGTDYVGPGNKINIDAPRSESDAIAKEHDIGYSDVEKRARTGNLSEQEFAEHIEQLDNDAIRKFAENFHTSGEWQSFVGRWGLYLKNRIERVTGTLYPSFPGKLLLWVESGKMFIRRIVPIGIR